MTDLSRRRVLAAGGVLTAGAAVGSVFVDGDRTPDRSSEGGGDPSATATPAATASPQSETDREDFVWAEDALWRDAGLRRNLLAFAARNDLSMAVAQADATDRKGVERLSTVLEQASNRDVPVWLNTGVLRSLTAETFVTDSNARERHLTALRKVTERYGETMPDGKMILWQEAPVAGDWIEGGAWNDAAVANLESYGPAIFERQRAAVKNVAPDIDVGIFLHFPYVIESRQPAVFGDLMTRLANRDASPDFVFTDFYRGWYEKDVGPGPANAAVRSLIGNARRHADAPAYFLGQAHTINPRHTPSTTAMRMDLRAATGAGAAGVGWYARTAYKQTRRGFDPFVPNRAAESAVTDTTDVNTLTVARDRYLFAYAQTIAAQAGVDPRRRFDLWVHGSSLDFHEHAVSVRTDDGWTFLGDVAGYVDDTYATGDEHVSVFHALDASRYVRDGTLDVRVETPADADGGHLHGLAALPFDPALYVTEPEATLLVGERDIAPFSLGARAPDVSLDAGSRVELSIPVAEAERPLASLIHPDWTDTLDALAAFERREAFAPGGAFDLWIAGGNRAVRGALENLDTLFAHADSTPEPAATAAGGRVAAAYGLSRPSMLGGSPSAALTEALNRAGDGVRGLYAMPYFGRNDFYTPERIAGLLDGSADEVVTFSVAAERR